MSAFDVAGAVVWTPLALLFSAVLYKVTTHPGLKSVGWVLPLLTLSLVLLSVFCIARLFGAHL